VARDGRRGARVCQLLTAARIYELLRFPPKGRFYHGAHRRSGRAAIVAPLPVAYHCIVLLGFGADSPRVLIHSLLGSALYGAVVVKVLLVRSGSPTSGSRVRQNGGLRAVSAMRSWQLRRDSA